VHGSLFSDDFKSGFFDGFLLFTDLLLEEGGGLHVSADGPSFLESSFLLGGHLSFKEDFSSEGSVSLSNEVGSGLSSLFLLESSLLSLFRKSRGSLLTDVVGLGRAEPVVPLHSIPESNTVFASTVVVRLILVPVLESKEGTVGPHPLTFLKEIVSTNPNGGFSVNNRFDLVLFSGRSNGGEMSSPSSAGLLGIGPVEFGVGDVLEDRLGSLSLADEFFLVVASIFVPFTRLSVHGNAIGGVAGSGLGRLSLSPVSE